MIGQDSCELRNVLEKSFECTRNKRARTKTNLELIHTINSSSRELGESSVSRGKDSERSTGTKGFHKSSSFHSGFNYWKVTYVFSS